MSKLVELNEAEQKAIDVVVASHERSDQFIREKNIRGWKRAEEYWRLNQFLYWDEVSFDYRSINSVRSDNDDDNEEAPVKTFPIYRSYGESIIAAMSAVTPSVLFFPDDADNPDDISTGKAYSKISELLSKHNKAPLLLIRILALLYNQGLAATYSYYEEDEAYGTRKVDKFKNEKVKYQRLDCPQCETHLASSEVKDEGDSSSESNDFQDELNPEEQKEVQEESVKEKEYTCPKCGYTGQPEAGEVFDETIPRLVGQTDSPKGRVCIDAWGPLNVRIGSYSKKQKDIGLLELQIEMDVSAAKDEFEEIADKIGPSSDFYSYERWGRTSSELLSDTLYNQVTVRYCWLRPWAYQSLGNRKDLISSLKRKCPHGCLAIFVNNQFARAFDESMDDHWTISENPLDSWLHGVPIGKPAIDTQDAFNELKNLELQKEEFGLLETFVSTDVLDEDAYRAQRAGPGYVTFVGSKPGESLSNSFFQTKTATVNEDDVQVSESYNTLTQFLTGAVPSIFGGNQVTGSKTALEYTQSRSFALQRLSNHWTTVKFLWAGTLGRACRLFAEKMVEDEKFVRKNANSFETVWIRKAELSGKVGNVEPDVEEQFPVSWAQKRDLLIQLITMQNPVIGEILLHPNNSGIVKDALGFPEFYVPGQADRTKQLIEIRKLINVDSSTFPPNSKESTVAIDPEVDDHKTHIEVIKLWAVSEEGLYFKETNPPAYLNVILHLKEHMMALQPETPQLPMKDNNAQEPPAQSAA